MAGTGRNFQTLGGMDMSRLRSQFHQSMSTMKAYNVESMKVRSETERFADSLERGNVRMGQAIKNHKLVNNLIREQWKLQRANAVEWSRDARGRISGDLILPADAPARLDSFRGIMNEARRGTISFSDAVDEAKIRAGMWNQVIKQGADNMVNWGKNMQWAGRQLTVGFTMPLGMFAAATGVLAYQADAELTRIAKVYDTYSKDVGGKEMELQQLRQASFDNARRAATEYAVGLNDVLAITNELAATGVRGPGLQEATLETARIMKLGELEYQDAVKATITLQNVYGMNTRELADAFNYMNMVENQTSLSIQDFAEAIPRAAGPLKPLGIGIKEIGLLMTTMKSRGIDAGEGANALKSGLNRLLNPSKEVIKNLKGFDININQIVNKSGGNMLKVLMALSDQMRDMDNLSRQRIIGKLFGTYQFGRVNAILQGLEDIGKAGTQVDRAFQAMQMSNKELSRSAEEEMARFQASASFKFMSQVRALQVELAEVGMIFLEYGDDIVRVAAGIMNWFNGLPSAVKNSALLVAALAAIAGPFLMLVGLTANLTGQGIRFIATLGKMALGWKAVNHEQVLAQKVGEAVGINLIDQANATKVLDANLRRLAGTMAAVRMGNQELATAMSMGMITPDSITKDKAGKSRWAAGTMMGSKQMGGRFVNPADEKAVMMMSGASKDIEKAAGTTQKHWKVTSGKMAAAAGLTGMFGTMFAESGSMASNLSFALLTLGMFPGVFSGIAKAAKHVGVWLRLSTLGVMSMLPAAATGAFAKVGAIGAKTMAGLKTAGLAVFGPIGVAAGIAAASWWAVNQEIDQTIAKTEEANNSAETFADVLGFTYTKTAQQVDSAGRAVDTFESKVKKLRDLNPQLDIELNEMAGARMGDKWGRAIAEGVKVRLHGGTVQAAEEATRAAMAMMGERFRNKEFKSKLKLMIDFGNPNEVTGRMVQHLTQTFQDAVDNEFEAGWKEGTARKYITGEDTITAAAGQEIEDMAEELWNLWYQSSNRNRKFVVQETENQITSSYQTLFDRIKRDSAGALKNLGIENGKQLRQALQSGRVDANDFALNSDEVNRTIDAHRKLLESLAAAVGGVSDKELANADSMVDILVAAGLIKPPKKGTAKQWWELNDAVGQTARTTAASKWMFGDLITNATKAAKSTNKLKGENDNYVFSSKTGKAHIIDNAEANKKMGDEVEKAGHKMADADHEAQKWQNRLDNIRERADKIVERRKNIFEGVNEDIFERAEEIFAEQQEQQMAALEGRFEARLNNLDRMAEQQHRRFEARGRRIEAEAERMAAHFDMLNQRLDDREERENRRFEDRWDRRTTKVERSFDRRIDSIERASEAEQLAEEKRQRIFEAEIRRIERMAEIANQTIDFNVALNSGELDEAAQIMNNMRADSQVNEIERMAGRSQRQSDKKVRTLEDERAEAEKRKEIRLKALERIQTAERRALDDRQKMRRRELEQEQKAAEKRFEIRRNALERETERYDRYVERRRRQIERRLEHERNGLQKEQEADRRSLENRLEALKAFVPRNERELNQHIRRVERAYRAYGVDLKASGNGWARDIRDSLNSNIRRASNEIANEGRWEQTSKRIANKLAQGAFGMNIRQFMKWIKTGNLPKGYDPSGAGRGPNGGGRGNMSQRRRNALNNTGPLRETQHDGGWIGSGAQNRRSFAGGDSRQEVNVRAQKGEFMVNKKSAQQHKGLLQAINSGRATTGHDNLGRRNAPTGIGGAAGLISPLFVGMAKGTVNAFANQINRAGQQKMQEMGPGSYKRAKPGVYGGRFFGKEQLKNAALIASVGAKMKMSARDIKIGIMTAITESGLINVKGGDRDSLGLFQQRPSQGWGTPKQVTNPEYAAKKFFKVLRSHKNRDDMSPWMAAQSVQRSAFSNGSNYRKYWDDAKGIFKAMRYIPGMEGGDGKIDFVPKGRKYPLSGTKPWVKEAGNYIGKLFNLPVRAIGGYRSTGSVPGSDHPKGLALDFMINSSGRNNKKKGNAIAKELLQNKRILDLSYIIWNRRIASQTYGWRWRRYSGPSPHTDHVHASFDKSGEVSHLLGRRGSPAVGDGPRGRSRGRGRKHKPISARYPKTQGIHDSYTGYPSIDIGAPKGTPIYAVRNGRVVTKANTGNDSYGRYLKINHQDMRQGSLYAHLKNWAVRDGEFVRAGQRLGKSGNSGGSTGPHLHFGISGAGGPYNYWPSLRTGGEIKYDNVIANLHKDEKVLTAPLSKSLEDGINNLDQGGANQYNVEVNFNGPVNSELDVQRAVEKAITNVESRKGRTRTVT